MVLGFFKVSVRLRSKKNGLKPLDVPGIQCPETPHIEVQAMAHPQFSIR